MPQSVLNQIAVEYQVALGDIGKTLRQVFVKPVPAAVPIPRELQIEAEITLNMTSTINQMKQIGDHSDFVCPDCGGGLWAVRKRSADMTTHIEALKVVLSKLTGDSGEVRHMKILPT